MIIRQWFNRAVKPWTVLIYADGNNDLEPEISQSLLDIERAGSGEDVNVIVQLARAPCNLVQTLRPLHTGTADIDGNWSGVRRYRVREEPSPRMAGNKEFYSQLVADLGNINMADPVTLYDFICWGVEKFPAGHYMLVLAGHGAGFMGTLAEYTCGCPQIMSIPGIRAVINRATGETGGKIDILVLDSCYMNMVEIIYELGIGSKAPRFLIAPEVTPIEGLPYHVIMEVIKRIKRKDTPQVLVEKLIGEVNIALANRRITLRAVRLHRGLLWFIKRAISNIAGRVIKNKIDLCQYANSSLPGHPVLDLDILTRVLAHFTDDAMLINNWFLKKCIELLIIPRHTGSSEVGLGASLQIFFPGANIFSAMKKYYFALQFTQNNQWLELLSFDVTTPNINTNSQYNLPGSEDLPLEAIMYIIMGYTPGLGPEKVEAIIKDMGWSDCLRLN